MCVFHVSPPLPLCGCCWRTWTIQFSGKRYRVSITSHKGVMSVYYMSLLLFLFAAAAGTHVLYSFQVSATVMSVYYMSLLLFLFAAAAGAHGLYSLQVSATGLVSRLTRELCLCVFHVPSPLPLCGGCWRTWTIQFSGKRYRVSITSHKGVMSVCIPRPFSSSSLQRLLAHMDYTVFR